MSLLKSVCVVSLFALAVAGCSGGGSGGGDSTSPLAPIPAPTLPAPAPGPQATLGVSPQLVDFNAVENQNPPAQTLTITTGAGWAVTSDASWLVVGAPSSGAGDGSASLWADVAGLQPGFYQATASVFSSSEGLSQLVPVSLMVSTAAPSGTPVGFSQEIRPAFNASVDPVSLQDNLMHLYHFPGVQGTGYTVAFDTVPSGQTVMFEIAELRQGGQMLANTVTTPFQMNFTSAVDARVRVSIFDSLQQSLSLSSLTVTPTTPTFAGSNFGAIFHVCGDVPLSGSQGQALGYHNGLATSADQQSFALDLAGRTNNVLPPQVQIATAGVDQFSNATVVGVDPTLVDTVVRYPSGTQLRALTGALGAPASDPTFGRALDIFVVHSPPTGQQSALGTCSCILGFDPTNLDESVIPGGTFLGNGPESALVIRLFAADGTPFTLDQLAETLAHELGHFFSLYHTTETDYRRVDDIPDSPFSVDSDGDGVLNDNGPDRTYVMHGFGISGLSQRAWSPGQVQAMQDYLSLRAH